VVVIVIVTAQVCAHGAAAVALLISPVATRFVVESVTVPVTESVPATVTVTEAVIVAVIEYYVEERRKGYKSGRTAVEMEVARTGTGVAVEVGTESRPEDVPVSGAGPEKYWRLQL